MTRLRRPAAAMAAICSLALVALAAPSMAKGRVPPTTPEVAAWGAGMVPATRLANRTIRMVTHLSIGGNRVRLRLSNHYGTQPLRIGALAVALRQEGGTALPGTHHAVRFKGKTAFSVAAGADAVSDPIELVAAAGSDLLVSLYLPETTTLSDWHPNAYETTYVSLPGNHVEDPGMDAYPEPRTSFYFLSGVSVEAPAALGTIVAFGDSITDGASSTSGANRRWPDVLARRLAALPGGPKLGVVNIGIGSNRVLSDHPQLGGESAVNRFTREVSRHPNVRAVILLEGINDIANQVAGRDTEATDIIAGYRQLIAQAHALGVKIIGATILPAGGRTNFTERHERVRNEVNTWIRGCGEFDAVFDFDAALRDPADPARLRSAYDSGDHLHPSDAGMQAIADSIDLTLLLSLASAPAPQ